MLPTVIDAYNDKNQNVYLSSRQKTSDYEQIRSNLKDLRLSATN